MGQHHDDHRELRREIGSATIVTIVRHGETAANTGGVWHGSTDTPLSDRGALQAQCVAEYLAEIPISASAIYASPLQRARNTARAIAERIGLPLEIESGLQEYDLGSWEGKSYQELHEKHRLWDRIKEDPDFAPHGGESPIQVVTRYVRAIRRIAEAHPGERVIAVGHGGALSMAFAQLLDDDYTSWKRVMGNCAVSELILEPSPRLLSFNVDHHLGDV